MSEEEIAKISEVGAYYIQFRTFTYLREVGTTINPKKLLRYPSDKIILVEISRQLLSAYDRVRKQLKICWTWLMTIRPFRVY